MKVLGRMMTDDGTARDVVIEAAAYGTAKILVKSAIRPDERLLFIRPVPE